MPGLLWSRLRNYLYDRKILHTVRPGSSVISVGNLTWGGTGKTSLVKELAQFLISKGLRVAILSRGYHGNSPGPLVVSDGSRLRCAWRQSGDEPYLLASTVPDAIVVVAEERSHGFGLIEPFSPDVIVLDDAFQRRKVERDLDIVLVDASEDITRQRVIPFGKLREEPQSLKRADAIVLNHQKHANARTLEWVRENARLPVFHSNYVVEEETSVRGKKIAAFCAIGAPHHFFQLLREDGAELVETKSFRDHHVFTEQEIQDFRRRAVAKGAEFMVTTAKDAVRMEPSWFDPFVKVIRVKLQIVEESLFFDFVMDRLREAGNRSQLP